MKHPPTILIAEDDLDDQELIMFAFSKATNAVQIQIVNDGKEAIEFLEQASDRPCLIVLDYNMPEINGAQVLQRLSADTRFTKIPKVILSTSSNPKYIADAMQKGAHAYKVKPHDFEELVVVAKELLQLCNIAA